MVFQYRGNADPQLDASEIDIILPGFAEEIFLEKLPVKTVSDVDRGQKDPMNQTRLRKHTVVIGPLTTTQKAKLAWHNDHIKQCSQKVDYWPETKRFQEKDQLAPNESRN